jgi:hypothetical protein
MHTTDGPYRLSLSGGFCPLAPAQANSLTKRHSGSQNSERKALYGAKTDSEDLARSAT